MSFSFLLCSSRKNPYPPHGRSSEIPRGRGLLKVKILEANYEAKLEFSGGTGVQNKKPFMGEYGCFLELHIVRVCVYLYHIALIVEFVLCHLSLIITNSHIFEQSIVKYLLSLSSLLFSSLSSSS